MAARKSTVKTRTPTAAQFETARDVIGYLNFSSGNFDAGLYRNLGKLWGSLTGEGPHRESLLELLRTTAGKLHEDQPAFADISQALGVLKLGLDDLFTRYRDYHRDLLFSLTDAEFDHPYFYAVLLEAVLRQGGPWDETERVIGGALAFLNDYVGYRPVAVLENDRKMEIYAHERFRPVPVYLAGAGPAEGRYHDLLEQTIAFLREAPQDILLDAHFDLSRVEEMCVDLREYDHLHPVNKRTNYLFGEWDPDRIDNKGFFRRFVFRRNILEALQEWVDDARSRTPRPERLFDAAAALCGTMLMASSVSGAGPGTHDSTVSLTSLLPLVARRRDEFYARVMRNISGARLTRLRREQEKTQQPFGHVRQYLNMKLAGNGARQVQHRELAHLYAIMGYPEASRAQARAIPAASIRLECEIECALALAHRSLDSGDPGAAFARMQPVPDLLKRGIECGAFVDPWNMLGFQGNFPLFSSREDAIPDNRIEILMALMAQIFNMLSRCVGEAAAHGQLELRDQASSLHQSLAEWWDRFGSHIISDLPAVSGQESWEAAAHVSRALSDWRQAGESAGDISFWRQRVETFQSAQSYALVVDALLQKGDHEAAQGLLMQWLSQVDDVGYECPQHTLFSLLLHWMKQISVRSEGSPERTASLIRRMFGMLEANAENWWSVPNLGKAIDSARSKMTEDLEFGGPQPEEQARPTDDEDDVFGAAYDGVVFRDSANDGNWGDTADGDSEFHDTEFETLNREFEPRLKFLNVIGQMWQLAAAHFAAGLARGQDDWTRDGRTVDAIVGWHREAQRWQIDLAELLESVWDHDVSEPMGDHDSNVEYDLQLQVKFYLLHNIITTLICLRNAERFLNGIIPAGTDIPRGTEQDQQLAQLYRSVIQRDAAAVRKELPALLTRLSRNPLLYVPLENGGEPGLVLRAQALQSVVRFLLRELPRLGLLRETWHVLLTAFRMERKYRPKGQAITEFDRLFSIAYRTTLESLIASARQWSGGEVQTEDLLDALTRVLEPYEWLWREHSRTMRISAADNIRLPEEWRELTDFIQRYGGDLFHASQLTLGNIRAILHNGVDWFLDYLEEEQDPLRPIALLEDLDTATIDREDAEWCLEQVYTIVVDRIDRFLEYNTTTTQSDYGEKIYSLLDFLRLEAQYDRDAWNLTPELLMHEVLVRHALFEAAEIQEAAFGIQTSELGDRHLAELHRLQRKHGMKMPAINDHLNERFVKPMSVSRILALAAPAIRAARADEGEDHPAFVAFREEVDSYLEDSWGSGVDLPDWLRSLEREVTSLTNPEVGGRPGTEADLDLPPVPFTREEFQQQTRIWRDGLLAKPGARKSRGAPRTPADDFPPDKTPPGA